MAVEISNVNELQAINNDPTADYVLVNNIDASATAGWNSGAGFLPIGGFEFETGFSGELDGNGFVVTGLYVDTATAEAGLVGWQRSGGHVRNLGVENCDITGSGRAGAVVSYNNDGSIDYCWSTGSVSGAEEVGGLCGRNHTNRTITNSFSHCSVTAITARVGGFVGNIGSGASLVHCYSTGAVGGTATLQGGLAGRVSSTPGPITACFWDTQTSGQATSAGGTGKTTAEMQQEATFTNWDFDHVWSIDEGNDYPKLRISR